MSSGLRFLARVTARHTCEDKAWNVENGFPLGFGFELTRDLILSIADSGNLKTFSRSGGEAGSGVTSPLEEGREMSSVTRVLRALVRSRKGETEMKWDPLQISAHELMKCHVEVPSRIAWLNAHPSASPSFSLVIYGIKLDKQ